eukprot:TRINITY_DN17249_c0_g1_i4.p1 TRINITY_DN17249_c0_g1~~TRINITY_DN17249_c0_g1_i4.p1  ORF type:complete len:425 (-),score=64.85 TRINITY_DN17249_c0_g1_i4:291-1565(-)
MSSVSCATSRRTRALAAAHRVSACTEALALEGFISAATCQTLLATVQECLQLLLDQKSKTRLLYLACEVAKQCVEVSVDVGLVSHDVVRLIAEGIALVASTFQHDGDEPDEDNDDGFGFRLQRPNLVARVMEPLCESIDGFAVQIFTELRRLESFLQPVWQISSDGSEGCRIFEAMQSSTTCYAVHAAQDEEDYRMHKALQEVCLWVLSLVVHTYGPGNFTAGCLWEFASQDAFCALVFADSVLSYRRSAEDPSAPPADLVALQRAVLHAALGLASQDIAFSDAFDVDDGEVGIVERQEFVSLRRATLAGVVSETGFLNCLLGHAWVTETCISDDILTFLSFVADLAIACTVVGQNATLQPALCTLEKAEFFLQLLRESSSTFWRIVLPSSQATRSCLRDCARLAYVSHEASLLLNLWVTRTRP